MTSERDVRKALTEQLAASALPRNELLAAVSGTRGDGTPNTTSRIAERILQRDMSFAEIGGDVCYVPALAEAMTWTLRVDAEDAARGFVRMHPALSPLGWWLISTGADLVDGSGEVLGRVTTDTLRVDDTDTDVALGPSGWLDAAAGGWAALTVGSETLQVTPCDAPPTPTPRQVAAMRAGFERAATRSDAILFDDEHAELVYATGDQPVLAALLADREAFVEAPVPFLPDLYAAAGLDERGGILADAGFDWESLHERQRRNRIQAFHGLDERQTDALTLLVGACELFAEQGEAALGSTDEERDGGAALMSALLEDGVVAETFWIEVSSRGSTAKDIEAFADALAARMAAAGHVEFAGLGWLRSRCMEARGDVRGAVELVEGLAGSGCEHVPLLLDAAAAASDRGDAPAALRLIERAGVSERDSDDADGELDEALLLLSEVLPYALHRPKARARRNDPCPCGSGRKYKACHLGRERHELSDRSSWLYDKASRYVRSTTPGQLTALAAELGEGSYRIEHELASSPFVVDLALHEEGKLTEFLEERAWLLPDDERMLVAQWALVDRGVFEIIDVRGDMLRLRDIGRGETITVVNANASDATHPGSTMIGRPLPVGDTYRAFGGFFPVPRHLVNPLIDAISAGATDELLALLASTFRPPQLRNTAGEALAFHTISWEVGEPHDLHLSLTAAGFAGDDDGEWRLTQDTPGMRDAIVASLRFDADTGVLVAEVNSDERATMVRRAVEENLPSARVLEDERRELDELSDELDELSDELDDLDDFDDDGAPRGALDPTDPEVRQFLDELIRSKEVEWLDEQIPALGGRTPREAVADPIGREEVRQLLASLPEPPPGEVSGFRASRLRALLELDD